MGSCTKAGVYFQEKNVNKVLFSLRDTNNIIWSSGMWQY